MTRSLAPLYVLAGMVAGLWTGNLAPTRTTAASGLAGSGLSELRPRTTLPVVGRETGIISQLDALDARATRLVPVVEAAIRVEASHRLALMAKTGAERRRAAQAWLQAQAELREALK